MKIWQKLKANNLGYRRGYVLPVCIHCNDEVSTSLLTAYNEAFDACTDPKDHRLKFLSLLFDSMADDAVEMSDEELVKLLGEEGIKESADRMRQLFDKVKGNMSAKAVRSKARE